MKITEAGVFKALLHYIYTDSLPAIDESETIDTARQTGMVLTGSS
jgi:hypothetical protein